MNSKDDDLERICRLAKEFNLSEENAAIKYGEYRVLNRRRAYNRTVNYLVLKKIENKT